MQAGIWCSAGETSRLGPVDDQVGPLGKPEAGDDSRVSKGGAIIRIVVRDDPISAVTEDDAVRRAARYPTVRMGAPVYGFAEDLGDRRWRVHILEDDTPQAARDGLAQRLRAQLLEDTDPAAEPELAAELTEAGRVLDWEKVDELTVAGRRFRIVRADTFARFGDDGPEPPRPTDRDPSPPGVDDQDPAAGFPMIVDPDEPTGAAHGALKIEVLPSHYAKAIVPPDVYADSIRALTTHPNGVLLPTRYALSEQVGAGWRPSSRSVATPQAARDLITFHLRHLIPRLEEHPTEDLAELSRAADQLDATRADEITVLRRRIRITRVDTLLRFGQDGPEPPRPSDHDPEPPPEAHFAQLREQGLLPDLE